MLDNVLDLIDLWYPMWYLNINRWFSFEVRSNLISGVQTEGSFYLRCSTDRIIYGNTFVIKYFSADRGNDWNGRIMNCCLTKC